jgi:hypothetical protein
VQSRSEAAVAAEVTVVRNVAAAADAVTVETGIVGDAVVGVGAIAGNTAVHAAVAAIASDDMKNSNVQMHSMLYIGYMQV